MEIDLINELITYWRNNNISIKKKSMLEINEILRKRKLVLPNDFKLLYKYANGADKYDKEGFLFYSIEHIVSVSKKFSTDNKLNNVLLFADYLQQSWWYGLNIIDNNNYQIGIIPNNNYFKIITTSLSDFIKLYLQDSHLLYEYE